MSAVPASCEQGERSSGENGRCEQSGSQGAVCAFPKFLLFYWHYSHSGDLIIVIKIIIVSAGTRRRWGCSRRTAARAGRREASCAHTRTCVLCTQHGERREGEHGRLMTVVASGRSMRRGCQPGILRASALELAWIALPGSLDACAQQYVEREKRV